MVNNKYDTPNDVYVPRTLENKIKKYLKTREIIAITGTRQCGKTTLLKHIIKNLKKVKSITFEDTKILKIFRDDIDRFIELYVKGYDYLFIDEVQYAKNSGQKLKFIYDTQKIKILITGSSSADLAIHSLKYLVGRIFIFELFPFSFEEFLIAKSNKLAKIAQNKKYGEEIQKELNKLLDEYILYGGYPKVVLADSEEEKKEILNNVYNIFLLKEVREILQLSENDKLISLMKALSLQIGNILNTDELMNVTGFNFNDLKKYIKILEETFICYRLKPFFTNKRTELVKTPKVYFYDSGFRNACIDNFNIERSDKGALYENFVFSELIRKQKSLKFWRTKNKAEIDFILRDSIPLEVKTNLKSDIVGKSFHSFIEKYKPKKGYIASLKFNTTKKIDGCKIWFLPFTKLVFEKY